MAKKYTANILNWLLTKFESTASNIRMNGTANAGSSEKIARADHVHPVDTSRAAANHTHTTLAKAGTVNSGDDLNDYINPGYYTCATGVSNSVGNRPFTGGYSFILEIKAISSSVFIQILYMTIRSNDKQRIYFRAYNDSFTEWREVFDINNVDSEISETSSNPVQNQVIKNALDTKWGIDPTDVSTNIDFNNYKNPGTYTIWSAQQATNEHAPDTQGGLLFVHSIPNGVVQVLTQYYTSNPRIFYRIYHNTAGWRDWKELVTSDDSRLSDARTPTNHTHGNVSNDGKVGSAANKPLITGSGGTVQAGSFEDTVSNIKMNGSQAVGTSNKFARGDHVHPKDTSKWDIAPVNLSESIDYDEYNTPGTYNIWEDKQSGSSHAPDIRGGLLLVHTIPSGVVQILIQYYESNPKIFYRIYHNTAGWRNWKTLVTSDDSRLSPSGSTLRLGSSGSDANVTIQEAVNIKVDRVEGKGLSTNDYTTTEKNKLSGIATGATKNTVSNSLTDTSTTNALSANQGKLLNDNKVDKVTGKGLSTNDYTTAERNKLAEVDVPSEVRSINTLSNSWNGSLKIISKNGWIMINAQNISKSTTTNWEKIATLNNFNSDLNSIVYDSGFNNRGVILRVRTNGDVEAKCYEADAEYFGSFTLPGSAF